MVLSHYVQFLRRKSLFHVAALGLSFVAENPQVIAHRDFKTYKENRDSKLEEEQRRGGGAG